MCVGTEQVSAAQLLVPSSQYPTIQSAVNAAAYGDTIIINAGQTYLESVVLKYKGGSGWITIQSNALASLPPQGARVAPSDATFMPKIVPPSAGIPAISTEITAAGPAHGYRLIGLEIAKADSASLTYDLIRLGSGDSDQNTLAKVAYDLVVNRCYVHGNPTAELRRGIALNSASTTISDSYVSDIHQVGSDTQAIGGWNGPGPYSITNNYLEAAGENVLFGGSDPSISNLTPADIVFRHNYVSKPLSWFGMTPSWSIKNLFELKNAKRVSVTENIFENNWAQSQNGWSVLFTVRNQDGTAPWSTVEDVLFGSNVVRNVPYGINLLGQDDTFISENEKNINISRNLFQNSSSVQPGGGKCFQITNVPSGSLGVQGLLINHNTCVGLGNYPYIISGDNSTHVTGLNIENNIGVGITPGTDASITGNDLAGTAALNSMSGSTWVAASNVLMLPSGSSNYPAGNHYVSDTASVGFVDFANGNYALSSSSAYKNLGTDGFDPGADVKHLDQVNSCIESGNWSACTSPLFDFDGDGRTDISLYRPSDSVWYLNQSRDGFAAIAFGAASDVIAPGDFDGDGRADEAVFRPATGTWYVLRSSDGSVSILQWGASGDIPVQADYDGDGRTDFAVWRPSNGVWYIVNSSDSSSTTYQFGLTNDQPSVGDYDGDGKSDYAVFRRSNATWYVQRSAGGFYAVAFGLATDKIAPADFDGDGRTDISVFRPSNGTWYRIDSSTDAYSTFQFGLNGDTPSPGDYDGDGMADLAVFRPSNGGWYLQASTEGFSAQAFGLSGDIPAPSTYVR